MTKLGHVPAPMTARELLIEVAGEEHALHTVVRKGKGESGGLAFRCSCEAYCTAESTETNRLALRNVAEECS